MTLWIGNFAVLKSTKEWQLNESLKLNNSGHELFILKIAIDLNFYPFPKQALVFTCLKYKCFKKIEGKGEIAWNKQFLLFPQCFLPIWRIFCHFHEM